ncbi:MAG: hypothetical protein A2Y20_10430 [Firmicutes bacterium GWF2_51_9]|nr:MAG: hypothetical protein A2Y20_10430 [Firmicutes bacterium GWF2_51_9]
MNLFDFDFDQHESIDATMASEILSVNEATIRNWVKSEILKPITTSGKMFFSKKDVQDVLNRILSGELNRLKTRRNKKFTSGNVVPKNYLESKKRFKLAEMVVENLDLENLNESDTLIILAELALRIFSSKNNLPKRDFYLDHVSEFGQFGELVSDLIENVDQIHDRTRTYFNTFDLDITYNNDDFLGLIYMAIQNLEDRKSNGVYYTTTSVVKEMVSEVKGLLTVSEDIKIIDPCCGTGNFLLEILRFSKDYNRLHGIDVDPISVKICRINIGLYCDEFDVSVIKKNIQCQNSLEMTENNEFDICIGNPPWGSDFSQDQKLRYNLIYESCTRKTIESFSLFLEKSIRLTKENGLISFVLPETFLLAGIHKKIREIVQSKTKLHYLVYWGNIFHHVQSPAISVTLKRTKTNDFFGGARVKNGNKEYTIENYDNLSNGWSLNMENTEQSMIELSKQGDRKYLEGNADFALGIVTGDNKKHILSEPIENCREIYKGSDVNKFKLGKASNYILYRPELYQQVAKGNYYFADEKLIYRFISDTLVFAYDNKKSLTLNSANILVPHIENLPIKFILAILNSSFADFYFKLKFKSVKVLRKHIESIPIPDVDQSKIDEIVHIVDEILETDDKNQNYVLYERLDDIILNLYGFDDAQKDAIQNTSLKCRYIK